MAGQNYQDACFPFTMEDHDDEIDIERHPRFIQTPTYQDIDNDIYTGSDYKIDDRVEWSADATIQYPWLETQNDGPLKSTSRNENRYNQVESSMSYQPNKLMMDAWSWYEPSIGRTINGPSTTQSSLAAETEFPDTTIPVQGEAVMSSVHEADMRYHALQSDAIAIAHEPTQIEAVSKVIDLTNYTSDTSTENDVEIVVGSVMSSGRFRCSIQGCHRRTFGRQAELRRHYYGTHTRKLAYWCETPWCARSKEVGCRPFPRKDKLSNHVRRVHGDVPKEHTTLLGQYY